MCRQHFPVDILLWDESGNILTRPWLTTQRAHILLVIDLDAAMDSLVQHGKNKALYRIRRNWSDFAPTGLTLLSSGKSMLGT